LVSKRGRDRWAMASQKKRGHLTVAPWFITAKLNAATAHPILLLATVMRAATRNGSTLSAPVLVFDDVLGLASFL